MVIKNKLITAKILTTSEISRIVLEGIGTVFFFYKTYFNNKPHKQNHKPLNIAKH